MTEQKGALLKKSAQVRVDRDTVAEALPEEAFGQRKSPENGRFQLQVDRQTKASYPSREAAEEAGLAIKRGFPILHVPLRHWIQPSASVCTTVLEPEIEVFQPTNVTQAATDRSSVANVPKASR
jgi:hypothetical protein